jgi:sarcosine oxidase gamma subunit
MTKYKVNVQTTDEYLVVAQNEEHARRIIAEHYSNNSLNNIERGDTEVYIFTDEE